MTASPAESPSTARVRLDKWLWAARFYKTRSAAAQAIDGGKVDIGGERAKRSRLVQAGDLVIVRRPPYEHQILVRGVSEVRGPAKGAALLYEETTESREARERLAYQIKNAPTLTFHGQGRPTKRDRRVIDKLKRSW